MPVSSKTEDLEAFLTVVDTGSFSSAANLLNQQELSVPLLGNGIDTVAILLPILWIPLFVLLHMPTLFVLLTSRHHELRRSPGRHKRWWKRRRRQWWTAFIRLAGKALGLLQLRFEVV